ncbi:MAG: hypothetical protein ACFFD4_12390 [Candidatus Odinarchaeota archaeon]
MVTKSRIGKHFQIVLAGSPMTFFPAREYGISSTSGLSMVTLFRNDAPLFRV